MIDINESRHRLGYRISDFRGNPEIITVQGRTVYLLLKNLHVITALLSVGGFIARGIGHWLQANWVQSRTARILPHANDTILLGSAVALAVLSHQYPLQQSWLTAKVIALLAYIALGMLAFRFRPRAVRRTAWFAAIAVAAYILGTAFTRDAAWPLVP